MDKFNLLAALKSIPWGVVAFVLVMLLCYWRIWKSMHAVIDGPYDPLPDDDGQWIHHEIKPEQPGPYRTRVYRKHHLESYSTVWNGRKWVFGAEECYFQQRDWRALPGRVTP